MVLVRRPAPDESGGCHTWAVMGSPFGQCQLTTLPGGLATIPCGMTIWVARVTLVLSSGFALSGVAGWVSLWYIFI